MPVEKVVIVAQELVIANVCRYERDCHGIVDSRPQTSLVFLQDAIFYLDNTRHQYSATSAICITVQGREGRGGAGNDHWLVNFHGTPRVEGTYDRVFLPRTVLTIQLT